MADEQVFELTGARRWTRKGLASAIVLAVLLLLTLVLVAASRLDRSLCPVVIGFYLPALAYLTWKAWTAWHLGQSRATIVIRDDSVELPLRYVYSNTRTVVPLTDVLDVSFHEVDIELNCKGHTFFVNVADFSSLNDAGKFRDELEKRRRNLGGD